MAEEKQSTESTKKPIWKKWWFWVLSVIGFFILIAMLGSDGTDTKTTPSGTSDRQQVEEQSGIGNGTYIVGTDIELGTYRSQGTSTCYWARLSGHGGQLGDIIGNGNNSPEIVTIAASDAAFETRGCGKWVPVEETYPEVPATSFSSGTYVVGEHIEPGTYRADGSADTLCYWARLSSFSQAGTDNVITNGNSPTVVQISAGDKGFTAFRCGTWSKI